MPKKGPRDLGKKTIPQLQNTLWPLIALYVKLNHAIDGYCHCVTCGKTIRVGDPDCQCGHWLPRSYSGTKYEEDNLRPQCAQCNGAHAKGRFAKYSGRPVEFERELRLQIGDERVEELKFMSTQPWKWGRAYLIEKINYYKTELKDMV